MPVERRQSGPGDTPIRPGESAVSQSLSRRQQQLWAAHLPSGTDIDSFVANLAVGSLPQVFDATARRLPEKVVLRIEDDQVTCGELNRRATVVASWLATQVAVGERVLVCAPNSVDMVTAYLAVLRRGAVAVLASPSLAAAELDYLVEDAGIRVALVGGPANETLRRITMGTSRALARVTLDQRDADDAAPWAAVLGHRSLHPLPHLGPEDPALIGYTSGTTGKPKGAVLSHGNLLASARSALAAWRWCEDDVLIHALPLTHQHGLGGVHATLLYGSRTVVLSRFDVDRMLALATEERPTVVFAVPAIYERLTGSGLRALGALGCLRLAVSGSAPLGEPLFKRISEELGFDALERYGTTESGLDVSNVYDGRRTPGTVGLPLPGIKMRILGPTDGDGSGEIQLSGPQVFTGYWNRPVDTADAFADEGWFRTGDLGHLDARGDLVITGRTKELIITGGLNVYPREVEMVLEAHPDVVEAAVAGIPSQRWGEQVTAWVVLREGRATTEADLIDFARERLATYKCPKEVRFASDLPRNHLGKLERRRLVASQDQEYWRSAADAAVRALWGRNADAKRSRDNAAAEPSTQEL